MKIANIPRLAATLTLVTSSFSASASTITTRVSGLDGRTCDVQLRTPESSKDVPIVLGVNGTGFYSMADDDEVFGPLQYLLYRKNNIAVLSMDKPGIGFESNKPIITDEISYRSYTQHDLIACAENALIWANEQKGIAKNGDIYLQGHSEGSQVVVRLITSLIEKKSSIANHVKMLMASGLPMENWQTIIESQQTPEENQKLSEAMKAKDDNAIKHLLGDLSYSYLEDIFKTETLRNTLERLSSMSPKPDLEILQGLDDKNVSVKAVQGFEQWNRNQVKNKQSSFVLDARYYLAEHGLNSSAGSDAIYILSFYMNQ